MKGREDDRQEPWLLIKEKDEHARPASEFSVVDERPDSVKALADRPAARVQPPAKDSDPAPDPASGPAGRRSQSGPARAAGSPNWPPWSTSCHADPEHWIFEIKFDGYRMLTRAEGGRVRLFTRNGNDWSAKLPHLVQALESMELPDGWYDGEIIMPGERVAADFQALQGAFDSARTAAIVYYLFDIPYCAGYDLREVPLVERRAVLQRIVERKPHDKVRFSAVFDAPPEEVLSSACRLGLEGVIAKRRNSAYVLRRSSDWIKLKCGQRQEFVIGGYTDPKGSRTGIGSLLLGVHDDDGSLRYAGNVGTGFNEQVLRDLREKLDALHSDASPFAADGRDSRKGALGQARADLRGGVRRMDAQRARPALGVPGLAHGQAAGGDHPRNAAPRRAGGPARQGGPKSDFRQACEAAAGTGQDEFRRHAARGRAAVHAAA